MSRCFLCLRSESSEGEEEGEVAFKAYCIRDLSRYLQMNLKKGFNVGEAISISHKLKLRVNLCEECALLNDKFSELYRQLERIELEVTGCLSLIKGKLVGSEETDRARAAEGAMQDLRREAVQKCQLKEASFQPRVYLRKLSRKGVQDRKRKLKMLLEVTSTSEELAGVFESANEGQGQQLTQVQVKLEPDDQDGDNDDRFEVAQEYPHVPEVKQEAKADESMEEEEENPSQSQSEEESEPEAPVPEVAIKVESNLDNRKQPGLTTLSEVETPTVSLNHGLMYNPNTSLWRCKPCGRTFPLRCSARRHFQFSHVNKKKKRRPCKECGKLLAMRSRRAYHNHYRKEHMRIRFRCIGCGYDFTTKEALVLHHQEQSCGGPWSARVKHHRKAKKCGIKNEEKETPDEIKNEEEKEPKPEPDENQLENLPEKKKGKKKRKFNSTRKKVKNGWTPWRTKFLMSECNLCHLLVEDIPAHLQSFHVEDGY